MTSPDDRNWSRIDANTILHPATNADTLAEQGSTIIRSGSGIRLQDANGHEVIDGVAGLWCVNAGYGRKELADAMQQAAMNLGYFHTFAGMSNQPQIELAERLLMENKKRVEIGTMAPLDEKQAEAQLASTKAALLGQRSQLVQTQTRLKNLLSKNYSDWWNVNLVPTEPLVATPLLVDLQTSWANGLELRPDLEDQRLTLEIAGIDLKYAKNQLLPQLDLSSTWRSSAAGTGLRTPVSREGFNDSFDDISSAVDDWESPFWGVNVTLSTPLTLMRERAQYRRQKAAKAQSQVILKQNEQNIMVDIENAVTAVQISFQQVSATRQEREFAEAALGAEEKKLEVGKSTSFIVLQLQRDLTTARSNEINALTSYNLNIANLAYLEGRTLDRFDLDMDASAVEREGSDDNAEVNPLLLPYISN